MRTTNCAPCDAGDEPLKVSTWRVHVKAGAVCTATYLCGVKVMQDDECPTGMVYMVDSRYLRSEPPTTQERFSRAMLNFPRPTHAAAIINVTP